MKDLETGQIQEAGPLNIKGGSFAISNWYVRDRQFRAVDNAARGILAVGAGVRAVDRQDARWLWTVMSVTRSVDTRVELDGALAQMLQAD